MSLSVLVVESVRRQRRFHEAGTFSCQESQLSCDPDLRSTRHHHFKDILPAYYQHGYRSRCGRWSRRSSLLRTLFHHDPHRLNLMNTSTNTSSLPQGRAGLVALRRARGGTSALGKAYYKGGFEKTMNRREAALILETS